MTVCASHSHSPGRSLGDFWAEPLPAFFYSAKMNVRSGAGGAREEGIYERKLQNGLGNERFGQRNRASMNPRDWIVFDYRDNHFFFWHLAPLVHSLLLLPEPRGSRSVPKDHERSRVGSSVHAHTLSGVARFDRSINEGGGGGEEEEEALHRSVA